MISICSLPQLARSREFEVFTSGAMIGVGLGILAVYHKKVNTSSPYDVKMSQQPINNDNLSSAKVPYAEQLI